MGRRLLRTEQDLLFTNRTEQNRTAEKKLADPFVAGVPAGLPAWMIVFVTENNWIAAAVESGGAPAMLVGLIIPRRGPGKGPRGLDIAFVRIGDSVFSSGMSTADFEDSEKP